jgi:hypothetical protein
MEYADHDKRMLILIIISNLPFPRLIIVQVLTVLFYVFCQHLWSFEKQEKKGCLSDIIKEILHKIFTVSQ